MSLRVVKHEQDETGFSVLIHDPKERISLWVDVWKVDSEILSDWNKYIFVGGDELVQEYQASAENFSDCTSEAIEYLTKLELI